jgi:hypothetical protein
MGKGHDDASEPRGVELRIRRDEELQRDIDEAKRRTGIRTEAELVRHALRRLAQGDEVRGG